MFLNHLLSPLLYGASGKTKREIKAKKDYLKDRTNFEVGLSDTIMSTPILEAHFSPGLTQFEYDQLKGPFSFKVKEKLLVEKDCLVYREDKYFRRQLFTVPGNKKL